MADTTLQKCTRCEFETDCIEGLCQECVLDLQDEARLMTELEQENENG